MISTKIYFQRQLRLEVRVKIICMPGTPIYGKYGVTVLSGKACARGQVAKSWFSGHFSNRVPNSLRKWSKSLFQIDGCNKTNIKGYFGNELPTSNRQISKFDQKFLNRKFIWLKVTELEIELVDHINVFRWQCIFKMIIKILPLSHKKPLMRLNEEKFWYFDILEIPMTVEMNVILYCFKQAARRNFKA